MICSGRESYNMCKRVDSDIDIDGKLKQARRKANTREGDQAEEFCLFVVLSPGLGR